MMRTPLRRLALAAALAASVSLPALAQTTVKVAADGDLKILDPIWTTQFLTVGHGYMIYDVPYAYDEAGLAKPQMIGEDSVSADGLTWTFKLREGVKFHSGKDFTSADVLYTFKRFFDPALGSGAKAVLEFLDPEGIKAVDKYTVSFTTKNPVVELPVLISNKFTNIVPEIGRAHV